MFNRLLHFFPPVVTGSVITVIGISLLPVAIRWAGGGVVTAPTFGSPANIGLAALTLAIILLIYRFLPGFFSRIAILAGLVLGTLVATALGMADFSKIGQAQWFAVSTPFHFGAPQFGVAAIVSMTIVMLVIMTETTADILAVGEVVDRPADGRTVVAGLRADCLSTAVSGGLLNSFSASAFAQNVGLVAITGHQEPVRRRRQRRDPGGARACSRRSGRSSPRSRTPVLGGAGLALFATVAASGIRALSRVSYEGNNNLIIVALSIGMGVIPIAVPTFYEHFPSWFQTVFDSGISSAAVTAVLLNLLFNVGRSGEPKEAATRRRVADGRRHARLRRAGRPRTRGTADDHDARPAPSISRAPSLTTASDIVALSVPDWSPRTAVRPRRDSGRATCELRRSDPDARWKNVSAWRTVPASGDTRLRRARRHVRLPPDRRRAAALGPDRGARPLAQPRAAPPWPSRAFR